MRRHSVGGKRDKRFFHKTAKRSHPRNRVSTPTTSHGGVRL